MKDKSLRKISSEDAQKFVMEQGENIHGLEHMIRKISKIIPNILNGTPEERKKVEAEYSEIATDIMRILETDTHFGLMEAVSEQYRGTVKELAIRFIIDYNCATSLEKAIANDIAHSYIKILDNSRRLNNEFNCKEITRNRTAYISVLSKQVDRANRQFINSIFALKQLKSPTLEMTIKTNNTFIANNQQINNEKKNNEA
ncbi:MAG: hypothetical protein FGM57_03900 [Candidatus Taylorbacteria bacterium]|nr:hypothetical protein [Candidatus Taylorbacteria bacterium]